MDEPGPFPFAFTLGCLDTNLPLGSWRVRTHDVLTTRVRRRSGIRAPGHCVLRRRQGLRPFPRTPFGLAPESLIAFSGILNRAPSKHLTGNRGPLTALLVRHS
jgi:hypothetical protein